MSSDPDFDDQQMNTGRHAKDYREGGNHPAWLLLVPIVFLLWLFFKD